MAKKNTAQAPLTPEVVHILLVLSTGERHGYGIMKQVEADSPGKVKMGPGTLYGLMGRLGSRVDIGTRVTGFSSTQTGDRTASPIFDLRHALPSQARNTRA
jgi:hypothetical protein